MNPFKKHSLPENRRHLKISASIFLLTLPRDDSLNEYKSAIKLGRSITFSCDPLLTDHYTEAEEVFKTNTYQIEREIYAKNNE